MSAPNLIGRPCPHCGADDNTGATFLCGTQHVGFETFQSQHCRDRVFVRDLETDDEISAALETRRAAVMSVACSTK